MHLQVWSLCWLVLTSDEAWGKIRDTILSTASVIVPPRRSKKRKWLSPSTLDKVDLKQKARLSGNQAEYKRLKGVFKARAKVDLED